MVHSVACRAIDDVRIRYIFAVMNEDGPDIYEDEEGDIRDFLEGKQEREEVVWNALSEAVEGMKRVGGVRVVVVFLAGGVVKATVYPVDAKVGEADEERELKVVIEREGCVRGGIVEFSVATDFKEEKGSGTDGHDRHRDHGLSDLEGNLILEVFGVCDSGVVEDEHVGEGGANEVED